MKLTIASLLFIALSTAAAALHAQDASTPELRLTPDQGDTMKQLPDADIGKRIKRKHISPDDQRQFPDSFSNEKRVKQADQRQWPDSVFDEKRDAP